MERFYNIAGVQYLVRCPDEWMYLDDRVLTNFRTEALQPDHTLDISIVEDLPLPTGVLIHREPSKWIFRDGDTWVRYDGSLESSLDYAYMRVTRTGCVSSVLVKRSEILNSITTRLVLNAMEVERQIVARGGFLLHASYICHNGRAILFTAPSGTGKSTQADLWCRLRGARLLNGDRAAVVRERTGIVVQGIPFCGSSGVHENESFPLEAIVYLSQYPKTEIVPLRGLQAFRHVWEGCSVNVWNTEDVSACADAVLDVVQRVPVFHLVCTPDESAVEALEKELIKLG